MRIREALGKAFHIFVVKKEERVAAGAVLLLLLALNAMVVARYYDEFTPIVSSYWSLFIRGFEISGFDPISLSVVSDWSAGYNVFRHPLLAFFMYPLYVLNQFLMLLTGRNCAIFVMAGAVTLCGFYSAVFFHRTCREVIGTTCREANALTMLLFSMAYVTVAAIVPDHFVFSMLILLMALYVSGRRMKSGRGFKTWQTVAYFILTAGTSLNNGLKVFLSSLFVNGRKFFGDFFARSFRNALNARVNRELHRVAVSRGNVVLAEAWLFAAATVEFAFAPAVFAFEKAIEREFNARCRRVFTIDESD